jgi:uroporphyrinogen-III synthase
MRRLSVLNTRPREQAEELSALLRQAQFDVVEAPAIAIESAWSPAELKTTRDQLTSHTYAWVVLPSANAARGLEADLAHTRVVCGTATARALGLNANIVLERFSAASALDALKPLLRAGDRVLVPRALEGRDELLDGLGGLGALVDAPVAYRTVPDTAASERLRLSGIDVVVLCSPSAVAAVAAAVRSEMLVACLGATTGEAARAHGLRVDATAQQTSMRSLVEAIETLTGARV